MAFSDEKLREHRAKRDFRKTTEPKGGEKGGKSSSRARFVIHEHDASTHHYDFRIEAGGALVSWAVPKGPSTDPSEKRLAVRTEDHPLDYIDFEGVIPEDQYGAGAVIVWDGGAYDNAKEKDDSGERPSIEEQLENGHVTIDLHGKKLKGGYALTRFRTEDGDESWLLVKMDDDEADARRNPTSTEPKSILSGKTVKEMAEAMAEEDGGNG